jgi:hypothetical protein
MSEEQNFEKWVLLGLAGVAGFFIVRHFYLRSQGKVVLPGKAKTKGFFNFGTDGEKQQTQNQAENEALENTAAKDVGVPGEKSEPATKEEVGLGGAVAAGIGAVGLDYAAVKLARLSTQGYKEVGLSDNFGTQANPFAEGKGNRIEDTDNEK